MVSRIMGYQWRQGYGYEGEPHDDGPYDNHQAAYARLRRANERVGDDWQVCGQVEHRADGWWIAKAQVVEIK